MNFRKLTDTMAGKRLILAEISLLFSLVVLCTSKCYGLHIVIFNDAKLPVRAVDNSTDNLSVARLRR